MDASLLRFLATSAALALAASLAGCGSGGSSISDAQAQTAPFPAALPLPYGVISNADADVLLNGNGSESIAFIGGGASGKLWVYDGKYHNLLTGIDADGVDGRHSPRKVGAHNWNYPDLHDVHAMVFKKDFSRLYTVNWFSYDEPSYAIEFDPKAMRETRRAPAGKGGHHASLSPDDKFLYVANQYGTALSVIDVDTFTKIKDIELGGMVVFPTPTMYWDGIAINTPYIFVTVTGTPPVSNTVPAPAGSPAVNGVAVIDWKTNTLVKTIPIGTSIHAVNLTPDGKEAWVSQPGGESSATGKPGTGDITVIDVASLAITQRIRLGVGGTHIGFSKDNRYAYVTGANTLNKVSRDRYQVVWTAVGESSLAHLGVSPDQKEVWILNHGMSKTRYPYLIRGLAPAGIQVYNADTGALVAEMAHESVSHEIQFVPRTVLGMQSTVVDPAVAAGSAIYAANCQACHGVGGAGSGLAFALNDRSWYNNASGVTAVVMSGVGGTMPAFAGKLATADIKSVAAYIASLNPPTDAGH